MRRGLATWAFVLLAAQLAGCGYGMQARSGPVVLPSGDRSLAISRVENPSLEVWLEPEIRARLRDEITRRGQVRWAEPGTAEALMSVTITHFILTGDVKGAKDQTLKYQASLTLRAAITDRQTGQVLWESGQVDAVQPYFLEDQEQAEAMVVELAVRELVDRMSQNY
ncbi:MAG: LPS assembly lipoprotein LptE [Desulfovibrionaceae bacterium]